MIILRNSIFYFTILEIALNSFVPDTSHNSKSIDSYVDTIAPSVFILSIAIFLSFGFLDETQSSINTGLYPNYIKSTTVCNTHTCDSIPIIITFSFPVSLSFLHIVRSRHDESHPL